MSDKAEREKQLSQKQKMEAIGTLASGIAHRFNNVLQAVHGYAEVLLGERDEGAPGHPELSEIMRAAQKGGELIRQLITFSCKADGERRPIDLNEEAKQVQKLLGQTMPTTIEIDFHLADDLRIIDADPARIQQIIMNLAANARDAMPKGGKMIIETENVRLDEQFCKSHIGGKPGDYVVLTIADTGHGMDKTTLERAFEPFYTTKGLAEANGLGLSVVYGIVADYGGYIVCTSSPGEGARFKIFLPAIGKAEGVGVEQAATAVEAPIAIRHAMLLTDHQDRLPDFGRTVLGKLCVLKDSCNGRLQMKKNSPNSTWVRGAAAVLQEAMDELQKGSACEKPEEPCS